MPFVPLHTKLRTRVLKPLYLIIVTLHLRRGNIGITDQFGTVRAFDIGIDHALLGGDQRNASLAHAVVIVQKVQLEHVCGTVRVETGAFVDVSPFVEAGPLELHVRGTDGTGPSILVVTQFNLGQFGFRSIGSIDQSNREIESNLLSMDGIFGTGYQYAHSPRQQRKGLASLDPLGNDHLEHLRFIPLFVRVGNALGSLPRSVKGGGAVGFGRGRGNDSHGHARPSHVGAGYRELLSVDGDGELLSASDAPGDFDHVCRLFSRGQVLIGYFGNVVAVGGQVRQLGSSPTSAAGSSPGSLGIGGINGNRNLQTLPRTRISRTLDPHDASSREHLKFLPGTNTPRHRDAERRQPSPDADGAGSIGLAYRGDGGFGARLGIASVLGGTAAGGGNLDACGDSGYSGAVGGSFQLAFRLDLLGGLVLLLGKAGWFSVGIGTVGARAARVTVPSFWGLFVAIFFGAGWLFTEPFLHLIYFFALSALSLSLRLGALNGSFYWIALPCPLWIKRGF
mmetsp:Transcript_39514/g.71134  ORF Transcript_39514/g.71134 Transcript_39514/m.71134 type:complete len:508 (+) Transcript_39514:1258-2781(+)